MAEKTLRGHFTAVNIGDTFGRLTVIGFTPYQRGRAALCRCSCGTEKTVKPYDLKRGVSRSCGCLRRELVAAGNRKHGYATRDYRNYLYTTWTNIKNRTTNAKREEWHRYGGRGILLYAPWQNDFEAFALWILANIGERPSKAHTIDRIDNDGPYAPGNLRWATRDEQITNRSSTVWVTVGRERLTLKQACAAFGVNYNSVAMKRCYARKHGRDPQSVVDAVFSPFVTAYSQ
jgi:hypothetical protein